MERSSQLKEGRDEIMRKENEVKDAERMEEQEKEKSRRNREEENLKIQLEGRKATQFARRRIT